LEQLQKHTKQELAVEHKSFVETTQGLVHHEEELLFRERQCSKAATLRAQLKPFIGLVCASEGKDDEAGVLVKDVLSMGSADRVSIVPYDCLLQVNEHRLQTLADLEELMARAQTGDVWQVLVRRGWSQHVLVTMPLVSVGVSEQYISSLVRLQAYQDTDYLNIVDLTQKQQLAESRAATRREMVTKRLVAAKQQ
jgi:hypothetical protein